MAWFYHLDAHEIQTQRNAAGLKGFNRNIQPQIPRLQLIVPDTGKYAYEHAVRSPLQAFEHFMR